jgi:hypothetical protein
MRQSASDTESEVERSQAGERWMKKVNQRVPMFEKTNQRRHRFEARAEYPRSVEQWWMLPHDRVQTNVMLETDDLSFEEPMTSDDRSKWEAATGSEYVKQTWDLVPLQAARDAIGSIGSSRSSESNIVPMVRSYAIRPAWSPKAFCSERRYRLQRKLRPRC